MSILEISPVVNQSRTQMKKAARMAKDVALGVQHSRGQMSSEVKGVLNRADVRTILQNKYEIGQKEVKMLDRTGPFRIELLSERRCLEGYDHVANEYYALPKTAGLVINPRKGSGLPVTIISSPESNLNASDSEFFAFCVKKAVDMVNVYKEAVSKYSTHSINKQLNYLTTQLESPVKTKLKDYKAAYVRFDMKTMKRVSAFFDNLAEKKLQLDDKFRVDRELALHKLRKTVIESWAKIQQEKFVAQTPVQKAQNKARAKALSTAREWERKNKLDNQYN